MFKRALVPLDTSELSETALDYAQDLVAEGGRITLLMVIDRLGMEPYPWSTPITFGAPTLTGTAGQKRIDHNEKHATDYLKIQMRKLENSGLETEIIVQCGNPAEEIVDFARKDVSDAIIMATHGRSGVSRWVMGSVTQKVLSDAPCPVCVIPQAA